MSSSDENRATPIGEPQRDAGSLSWNRRLHYLVGLYFLLFLWLFSASGLLLNHGSWGSTPAPEPSEWRTESVAISREAEPAALARDLMRQLRLSGEIQLPAARSAPGRLSFRVVRATGASEVTVDLPRSEAAIRTVPVNTAGVQHSLHTFSGVRRGDSQNKRDWWATTVWVLAMDALCLGVAVLVLTGIAVWIMSGTRRVAGMLALASGTFLCAWFVSALDWFSG